MATLTDYVNRDSRIARRTSDSWDAGSGVSDGLPFGLYSGYQYRTLLYFGTNTAGWTSLTSAILHIRTSSQIHVAFGSSPTVRVQRLTASFSEGTADALSSSNAVIYPGPSATDTNAVNASMGTTESAWKTINITAMVQDVLGGTFHGVRLIAWNGSAESTSAADVGEIFSREQGSSDAYIVYTYSTNSAPSAPTSMSPTGGSYQTSSTPTLAFTHSDPDGDALLDYDLQVSTDSTFASVTHWNIAAQTTGITGNNVSRVYAGTALTTGTLYYWRARTSSSAGVLTEGAWSAAQSFRIAATPVATLTEPSAAGRLGKLVYTAGSGWTSPRLSVAWSFSCSDGGTQSSYEVDVANDLAGAPDTSLYASGVVAGTATSLTVPANLTEGSYYHVRVRVTCSHNKTSSYSGYFRLRSRWGVVAHRKDLTTAPTSWSVSTLNTSTGASSSVTMEYGSDSAANATPSSGYKATLAEAPLARYFYYRTWLLSWGASPATSPSLDKLVLSYSANVLVPDKWTRTDTTNSVVDESTFVYGTQSLKMLGKGSVHTTWQRVAITPDTNYVLSARAKVLGNPVGQIILSNSPTGGTSYTSYAVPTVTTDWARYSTPVWNSGAQTEVYVRLIVGGAASTAMWIDAVKLEASSVVTPWTPSFLADAVVLDAGGLQIDGAAGGIFRLRGSAGGTRDRVDLGANGLKFGGDYDLYSDVAGELNLDGGTGALNGKRPVVTVFTANGTWNKPANLSHIIVEVVGGGGGGAGAAATTAGNASGGGSGGGGGYARKMFTAADLAGDSTYDVVVGGGGAGVSGATAPNAGSPSSFAGTGITTVQGNGGGVGAHLASGSSDIGRVGGTGGTASGGDINVKGAAGQMSFRDSAKFTSGTGGSSALGGGGVGATSANGSDQIAGNAGGAYGGGGSGAISQGGGTAATGGNGADGVVIVTEFYGP